MTVMTEFPISSPSLPLISLAESLKASHLECVDGLCLEFCLLLTVRSLEEHGHC